ncbi:ImmA/IrrE family metallo-endopeptidase, partial [Frankia sp. AvcI1]
MCGVPVYPLQELGDHRGQCSEAAIRHFALTRRTKWSAALVAAGTNRMVIDSASHEQVRRRSNLAHEISHLVLEHEFDTLLLTDDTSCFTGEEKEAMFLARELLIPEEAAKCAAFRGLTNEEVGV